MKGIEIKIPSEARYLKIVRCGLDHMCDLCEFSRKVSDSVTLAVHEAVCNIIEHAYENKSGQPIIIRCKILEDRLEIVLRDFGTHVDLAKIKSRELEDIRPGGLGVHLINSTMDIVQFDNSLEDGNQLTLAKYLPK